MRNIWRIIRTDTRRIFSSVVAFIIIMGLCVVPVLYAWFNIFSNWDPYGESATSRIRVAVATKDRGTSLLGLRLNVGNQMVETLKTNTQIGWVFAESEDEALWRVYSGDCYAALIVPEDFSKDIVSFMTLQFEHPELHYYENGKKNAIAPKITGKAKTAVQETVNTVFLQTIVGYAAEVVEILEENGWDPVELMQDLSEKTEALSLKIDDCNYALDSLVSVTGAAQGLLLASGNLVSDMSDTIGLTATLAGYFQEDTEWADSTVRQTVADINAQIQQITANLSSFQSQLAAAAANPETYNNFINGGRDNAVSTLNSMANQIAQLQSVCEQNGLTQMANLVGSMLGAVTDVESSLSAMEPVDVSDNESWAAAQEALTRTAERMGSVSELMSAVFTEVARTLGIQIEDFTGSINSAATNLADVLRAFESSTAGISNTLYGVAGSVASMQTGVLSTKAGLSRAKAELQKLSALLADLSESDFLQEVLMVLGQGSDILDAHIASPLKVGEEVFYAVETYGSEMAPFYTVLAQWVGALFCAALLKTHLERIELPRKLRLYQHFFGRYSLFLCVGLIQALITVLGDLFYVRIDCMHPWLFLLSALVTGVCFSMINYALSFTLGSIGLGASVIIMVVQVAGSGGTYPVDVLPKVFRILYPFMPFKFAMNAMREAICGLYGDYYWQNIRALLGIAALFMVLAFVIYVPAKWINDLIEKSKRESEIMI